MRIIKNGNNGENFVKFICENCKCEFECTDSEYWTDTSVCLTSYPPQYYVMASCPCCHKVCRSTKSSKNRFVVTGTDITGCSVCAGDCNEHNK